MYSFIFQKWKYFKIRFRIFWWGKLFSFIGENTRVLGKITVSFPSNIKIGEGSTLNEGVLLNARASLEIGNFVHISSYCIINTGGLDYSELMDKRRHVTEPIVIKDGVWLGSGVIINPGVIIGRNSVIGAGAVVTSDIPDNCVAVGIPAKVIKNI